MKKKIILIVGAIVLLVALFVGKDLLSKPKDPNAKEIQIVIKDDTSNLMDKTFTTSTFTLAEFLVELEKNDDIELEYQDSTYGMYIIGLGVDDTLISESPSDGLYWIFSSKTNPACQTGFCPSAEDTTLENGDVFTFERIKY